MAKKIEITLVRGLAARSRREKATVRSLGLRKPHQKVIRDADPCTLGNGEECCASCFSQGNRGGIAHEVRRIKA